MADRFPAWSPDVVSIDAIAATIRQRESGGNYTVVNPGSGNAAGAYQFLTSTWQSLTRQYGIGTQYSTANLAPPEVQDAVAKRYIGQILQANKNDILSVPYTWYVGNPKGTWQDSSGSHTPDEVPKGNKVSVNDYVKGWLADFIKQSGQSPPKGTTLGDIITNIPNVPGQIGQGVADGAGAIAGVFGSVTEFLGTLWGALTNRDNWIRVGMVFGAIILAIFGMMTVSRSFGGPGVSDVAGVAGVAAKVA